MAALVARSRAQRQSLIRPLVVIAQPDRVDLGSIILGMRRGGMHIEVSAAGPGFDNAKVSRPCGLLEKLKPAESALFPAGIPVLFDRGNCGGSGGRCDLHVSDRIGGTIRWGLGGERDRKS